MNGALKTEMPRSILRGIQYRQEKPSSMVCPHTESLLGAAFGKLHPLLSESCRRMPTCSLGMPLSLRPYPLLPFLRQCRQAGEVVGTDYTTY